MAGSERMLTLRVAARILERADQLVASVVADDAAAAVTPAVTRSYVLRLALSEGLAQMEKRYQRQSAPVETVAEPPAPEIVPATAAPKEEKAVAAPSSPASRWAAKLLQSLTGEQKMAVFHLSVEPLRVVSAQRAAGRDTISVREAKALVDLRLAERGHASPEDKKKIFLSTTGRVVFAELRAEIMGKTSAAETTEPQWVCPSCGSRSGLPPVAARLWRNGEPLEPPRCNRCTNDVSMVLDAPTDRTRTHGPA